MGLFLLNLWQKKEQDDKRVYVYKTFYILNYLLLLINVYKITNLKGGIVVFWSVPFKALAANVILLVCLAMFWIAHFFERADAQAI